MLYISPLRCTGGSGQSCWSIPHNYFQFIPSIPGKQTITLRLNPDLTLSLSLNLILNLTITRITGLPWFQFIPGYELKISVRTPSGIVYLGHLYAGESGQFRPLIFLGPVRSGAVFRRTGCYVQSVSELEQYLIDE